MELGVAVGIGAAIAPGAALGAAVHLARSSDSIA
jgi:hypothetical protein